MTKEMKEVSAESMIFDKLPSTQAKQLKPLYIKAHIDGKLISCMLIYGRAIMNVMLVGISKKLRKTRDNLKETNTKMTNFISKITSGSFTYKEAQETQR